VGKLLKAFWLPDAQILENHYQGRTDGWGAVLSHYRGDVTHHGYLDILEADHDWKEIAAISRLAAEQDQQGEGAPGGVGTSWRDHRRTSRAGDVPERG
jgi:hypothetical protein